MFVWRKNNSLIDYRFHYVKTVLVIYVLYVFHSVLRRTKKNVCSIFVQSSKRICEINIQYQSGAGLSWYCEN